MKPQTPAEEPVVVAEAGEGEGQPVRRAILLNGPQRQRPAELPPKRPRSITLLAVCHFIAAPIALAISLLAVILLVEGVFVGMFPKATEFQKEIRGNEDGLEKSDPEILRFHRLVKERLRSHGVWIAIDIAVLVAFAAVLIWSAIGLLGMRPWGRYLSLGFSTAALVRGLAMFLYALLVAIPSVSEIQSAALELSVAQESEVADAVRQAGTVTKILMLLMPLLTLPYPLISLIVLVRPSMARRFRGQSG